MDATALYGGSEDHPTLMVGSMITGSAEHASRQHIERHRQEIEALRPLMEWQGYASSGYQKCLDLGGGHGVHAPWLQEMTEEIIVADVINYNSLYEGSFLSVLMSEFSKHSVSLDLSRIEFHRADAQRLPYRGDLFDLVVSINAFEHIPEPKLALDEAIRVSRSGAIVYIQFDPLWHSPSGHHLWHLGFEPWAHLLVNDEEFRRMILDVGGSDSDVAVFDAEMNRKSFKEIQNIFDSVRHKAFSKSYVNFWAKDESEEPAMLHGNFERCLAMGYDRDDLIVRGFQFIGQIA